MLRYPFGELLAGLRRVALGALEGLGECLGLGAPGGRARGGRRRAGGALSGFRVLFRGSYKCTFKGIHKGSFSRDLHGLGFRVLGFRI